MRTSTPSPTAPTAEDSDSLPRQRQRFEWLADRIRRWAGYYEVEELERFARGSAAWPGQREKAIVLLALTDTEEAERALLALDVTEEPRTFQMLYRVALEHTDLIESP